MLVAVPCSDDDCVLVLDTADGSERGRIGVGDHPVHLAVVDDRVFVATMGDRAVSVVADGEVHRVETGVLGPSHFATTDDGDALAIVDAERLELRARVGVGAEPHDVAIREGLAFVGSRADGVVTVVDPAAETVEATHDLGNDARIQGVEAAAEGVYAVDQRHARLHRLTAAGVEGSAPVGENPYDAVVADARVLVAGRDDGTVTAVPREGAFGVPDDGGNESDDGPDDREVYDVGGRPSGVVLADDEAWVLDRDRSRVASLPERPAATRESAGDDTSQTRRRIDVPYPTFAATTAPDDDDTVLYVSHYDDAAVSAVDLDDGRVLWTAETPAHPFEPAVV